MTAFHSISNQGSSHSRTVTGEVEKLRGICLKKSLTIRMLRILGNLNVVADALSRPYPLPGEGEISPQDWAEVLPRLPGLEVDLIATPYNYKLPTFVSLFLHHLAISVDARLIDWISYPPPTLLATVVVILNRSQGEALLIRRLSAVNPLRMTLSQRIAYPLRISEEIRKEQEVYNPPKLCSVPSGLLPTLS